MELFHDSRDCAYRAPYGAITVGEQVQLTLEVQGVPDARVTLRTWEDGEGEQLLPMDVVKDSQHKSGDAVMYRAALTPDVAGAIWYHFIVEDGKGGAWRYGARDGRRGGPGEVRSWEPPSFQLNVFEPQEQRAWYEPIGGYLFDAQAEHDAVEVVETLCENTPEELICNVKKWFVAGQTVIGFWMEDEERGAICTLFNASTDTAYDVLVPLADEEVSELVSGYGIDILAAAQALEALEEASASVVPACGDNAHEQALQADASASKAQAHAQQLVQATGLASDVQDVALVHMAPLARVELQFHPHARLQRPLQPGVGVLAHITSLPGGTLGSGSHDQVHSFVDWLADAGVRYWQILPVNPTDEYGSPYAGISAFAGNVNLLEEADVPSVQPSDRKAYKAFCKREADWLEPYAAFMAIRQTVGEDIPWQDWPSKFLRYTSELVKADAELAVLAEAVKRSQFAFDQRWQDVRAYANERGVQIIGDMPIYVSADSADVWANPELFQLDAEGRPSVVAGCPPDAFAVDGQIWGNPVYDWDAMRARGYDWWLRRLERAFSLYDWVRLDHFIGFSRYFSIPVDAKASEGSYHPGPGLEFFREAQARFGQLPLIAEDLGLITPGVRSLIASCGFAGMDIMQFVDGNDPLSWYEPRPGKIVYTGTHDNQTLVGYVEDRYPDYDACEVALELMEIVASCKAGVCVFPLQDVLFLDDEARMNVPGVAEGNWSWQAEASDIEEADDTLKQLVKLHDESMF